mgnify:CR=1 FL=1
MTWLSVHLFYEDLDQLLVAAVFPFLKKTKKDKKLEQYFFIRYSEGGKHIRLRIKTQEAAFLKGQINLFFNAFFKATPSKRERESIDDYPNNSIQYITYEPEFDRYGGQKGIEAAEKQFHLSSEIVQKIIENTPKWDYESAMGISIQLQLVFLSATGFERSEALAFFDFYYKKWSTVLPKSSLPKPEQINNQQGIINFVQSFWKNLEGEPTFGNQILESWYSQNRKLMLTSDLSTYYDSYLHLLNNRLGIFNIDEVFLAKLLHKSML